MWITVCVLVAIIITGATSPHSPHPSPSPENSYGTQMNVKDVPPNTLWWMKGSTTNDNGPELNYAEKLLSLVNNESRSDLRAVYGNCFVNPGNTTLFIVLTRCDSETTALFNKALDPLQDVHIVYRTGPATHVELERYMEELGSVVSRLPRDVVEINSYSISENATILVGMGKISQSSVTAFADAIRGIIPEELIVIRHMDMAVLV
ncbi:MAG: hypothetical protein ABSA11_01990 [Candidatus Bathyarchaeia archaeon]